MTPFDLPIDPAIIALLTVIAAIAGFVDAIAGGGGLIVLPALLWAGLTPIQALATNKLQAVFGSFAATARFYHHGVLKLRVMAPAVGLTFVGAATGATTVQLLDPHVLAKLIPLLLIGFALYFLMSPRIADLDAEPRMGLLGFAATAGFGIGFYDGFFGPGTGSFFAFACVALLGHNLTKATAHAKLLNFTSNLASLLFFILGGHTVWLLGLSMALGQTLGGWLGAHTAIRHGAALIRPLLVVVSILITLKLWFGSG